MAADPNVVTGTIVSLLHAIPETTRGIYSLPYNNNHAAESIETVKEEIEHLTTSNDIIRQWCDRIVPQYSSECILKLLVQQSDHIDAQLNRKRARCEYLQKYHSKPMSKLFPKTLLSEVQSLQVSLQDVVLKINSIVPQLKDLQLQPNECGLFKRVFNMVPENPPYCHFDFATDTFPEAILRKAILDYDNRYVIATASGGCGKTVAVRAIARMPETRARFPDGIFFFSVGSDAGYKELKGAISLFLSLTGNEKRANSVNEVNGIGDVMLFAEKWFEQHQCLFVFDDIWLGNGITADVVKQLLRLASNRNSKVVLTTRLISISGTRVSFNGRSQCADMILLKAANAKYPTSREGLESFQKLVDMCYGLPIALHMVGSSVRSLLKNRDYMSPENGDVWTQQLNKYMAHVRMNPPISVEDIS